MLPGARRWARTRCARVAWSAVLGAIDVAEDNFISTFSLLAELAPRGAAAVGEGALHLHSGAQVAPFNPTIVREVPDDVDGLLDAAAAFHEQHESPAWIVAVRAADGAQFAPAAQARGFTVAEDSPFMVLDRIPGSVPVSELQIRRASDLAEVRAHFELVSRSFGTSMALIEVVISEAFLTDRAHLFIGELDGVPVASSMLVVSDGAGVRCAGIYNVGTLEPHRRRGLGEVMTAHAAEIGRRDHGCAVATLQSSPMGYPVYERMGYREVTRWQRWHPPA